MFQGQVHGCSSNLAASCPSWVPAGAGRGARPSLPSSCSTLAFVISLLRQGLGKSPSLNLAEKQLQAPRLQRSLMACVGGWWLRGSVILEGS